MNPYEKTAQEMKRQSEGPKRFAKTAGAVGSALGAASFAPMLSRAAPFLSQYIPEDLAIKGLSKISPKFGSFVKSAMEQGYDFPEVKDFIGQQIEQSQPKEDRNIVQQYSPELHNYISGKIKSGQDPVRAGALAFFENKDFEKIISKIEKDHKTNWSDLIQTIYGRSNPMKSLQESEVNPQQMQKAPIQQGQQPQGGAGSQALMGILQKIQQARGSQ